MRSIIPTPFVRSRFVLAASDHGTPRQQATALPLGTLYRL